MRLPVQGLRVCNEKIEIMVYDRLQLARAFANKKAALASYDVPQNSKNPVSDAETGFLYQRRDSNP
jgi:hypothetical protein